MLNTQQLLQRLQCSGASFTNHVQDSKPSADSKTEDVNVRLKIFWVRSRCRHPLTVSKAQEWMSFQRHVSAIITTPVLIKACSSVPHKRQRRVCWFADTPQVWRGKGKKSEGALQIVSQLLIPFGIFIFQDALLSIARSPTSSLFASVC